MIQPGKSQVTDLRGVSRSLTTRVNPTIKNLYLGDHPTYWMAPGIPHDAYLGEFLMRTKAVIRD